jgi:Protein of unknown function (DUF1573)
MSGPSPKNKTDNNFSNKSNPSKKDELPNKYRAGWPITICACLPFLFSIGFHSVESKTIVVKEQAERPALTFQQYSVNLRTVELRSVIEADFKFTNTSDKTVKITDLTASCGCLNPRMSKKIYEPGEQGYFEVRVSTPNSSPGEKEYTIDLEYEDSQPRSTELTFKFRLPEKMVMVRPLALQATISGDEIFEKKIKLLDYRKDEELEIKDVECVSFKNGKEVLVPESLLKTEILKPVEIDNLYANAEANINQEKVNNVSTVEYRPGEKPKKVVQAGGQLRKTSVSDQLEELKLERESIAGIINLKINPKELKSNSRLLVRITTTDPRYPVVTVPLRLKQGKANLLKPSK